MKYEVMVENGSKEWRVNGKLHREDGPAIECTNYKAWYANGELHREDGPAIEYAGGYKAWWINGKRHREDGPAVEYADGYKAWYLNGKQIPEPTAPEPSPNEVWITKSGNTVLIIDDPSSIDDDPNSLGLGFVWFDSVDKTLNFSPLMDQLSKKTDLTVSEWGLIMNELVKP